MAATKELEKKALELEKKAIEHDLRLTNGVHAFQDLKQALVDERAKRESGHQALLSEIEAAKPKPSSPVRVAALVLSIVLAGGGALWGLSEILGQKVGRDESQTAIQRHEEAGHKHTSDEIRTIREEQIEQRVLIKEQGEKLDKILERVPDRRRRR